MKTFSRKTASLLVLAGVAMAAAIAPEVALAQNSNFSLAGQNLTAGARSFGTFVVLAVQISGFLIACGGGFSLYKYYKSQGQDPRSPTVGWAGICIGAVLTGLGTIFSWIRGGIGANSQGSGFDASTTNTTGFN